MASKREVMPEVAKFIDELRELYGKEEIDAVIKQGLKPDCEPRLRFWASEGGHVLGQQFIPASEVSGEHLVIRIPEEEAALMKRLKRR